MARDLEQLLAAGSAFTNLSHYLAKVPWVYFWTIPARNKWVISYTLVMNQVSRVSLQKKTRMNWATYDSWGVRSKLGLFMAGFAVPLGLFMAGLTVPSWPRRGDLKVRSMLHLLPKGVASLRSSCHHSQLAVVPFRFGVCWPSDDFLGRDHIHPGHEGSPHHP